MGVVRGAVDTMLQLAEESEEKEFIAHSKNLMKGQNMIHIQVSEVGALEMMVIMIVALPWLIFQELQ